MLIAHLRFAVAPKNRTLAIDTLKQEANAIRAVKGCIAAIPFLDPTTEQDVGVLHEWESANDFAPH